MSKSLVLAQFAGRLQNSFISKLVNQHIQTNGHSQYCSSSSSPPEGGGNKPESAIANQKQLDVTPRPVKTGRKRSVSISMKNMVAPDQPPALDKPPTVPACSALLTPLSEHEIGLGLTKKVADRLAAAKKVDALRKEKDKKDVTQVLKNPEEPPARKKKPRKAKKDKYGLEVLSQTDCFRRVHFTMKLLFMLEDEPKILDNILFTDECNFNLPRLPPPLITKPPIAESEKLPQIAWCGITPKGTVGPYFYNAYVTDKSYLKMLEKFLMPELEAKGYNLKDLWFQQDGALWHRNKKVLDFLTSVFDYRVISLGAKFAWPPRSQDLTPMDYFFWDHLKDRMNFKYSKYDLCFQKGFRETLTTEVNAIKASFLRKAIYELPQRLDLCLNGNGDRFYDLMGIEPHTATEDVTADTDHTPKDVGATKKSGKVGETKKKKDK